MLNSAQTPEYGANSDNWGNLFSSDYSDDRRDYAEERANLLLMHEECEGCETCQPSAFYVSRTELDNAYEAFLSDLKATKPDEWADLVRMGGYQYNRPEWSNEDFREEPDNQPEWFKEAISGYMMPDQAYRTYLD